MKIRLLRNHDVYKGYKISGSSIPMYMEGCESRGSVCKPGRAGSIIEVARIKGTIFDTMKEAEAHGVELAKEWVDRKCLEAINVEADLSTRRGHD